MFRDKYPLAWTFHRNTSRWPFNVQEPPSALSPEAPYKEYLDVPLHGLPEPDMPLTSLTDAISARLACRRFTEAPVKPAQLAGLLKLSYGIQGRTFLESLEFFERPVPSGGGLYPLELYIIAQRLEDFEPGIYHYAVLQHALEQVRSLRLPEQLTAELFMGQPYVAKAPVIIVITAIMERSLWKYGDRGYRYLLLEAGHVAQNLNLLAAALGLGSLNLGGFFDSDITNLLDLDIEKEVPLYGIALGAPAGNDRMELRQPPD